MAAAEVQKVQDSVGTELVYVTILIDDFKGESPDEADCKEWAERFGITAPVLQGSSALHDSTNKVGWDLSGIPAFWFLNRSHTVVSTDVGYGDSLIQDHLTDILD